MKLRIIALYTKNIKLIYNNYCKTWLFKINFYQKIDNEFIELI